MATLNIGTEVNAIKKEKAQLLLSMGKLMHKLIRDGKIASKSCDQFAERLAQIDAQICIYQGGNVPQQGSGVCPICNAALASPMAGFCGTCGTNINGYYSQSMVRCATCGQLTKSSGGYCTICGVRQEPGQVPITSASPISSSAFCTQCGQPTTADLKFCTACGAMRES